jgi:hypothetical protein
MPTRRSANHKNRPDVESLDGKVLLSAGLHPGGAVALAGAPALVASQPWREGVAPCGTGTGIIIITRCENSPSSTLAYAGGGDGKPIMS